MPWRAAYNIAHWQRDMSEHHDVTHRMHWRIVAHWRIGTLAHWRRYMTDAYHNISKIAADHKVPLRVAAYLLAVKRVATAEQHRGFD